MTPPREHPRSLRQPHPWFESRQLWPFLWVSLLCLAVVLVYFFGVIYPDLFNDEIVRRRGWRRFMSYEGPASIWARRQLLTVGPCALACVAAIVWTVDQLWLHKRRMTSQREAP
ncbi:MAG TPA: hypothetical protein VD971_05950 [Phycisphaerales bacterium]|nr:hypothetical protein [Phycisphaerales bacterium]